MESQEKGKKSKKTHILDEIPGLEVHYISGTFSCSNWIPGNLLWNISLMFDIQYICSDSLHNMFTATASTHVHLKSWIKLVFSQVFQTVVFHHQFRREHSNRKPLWRVTKHETPNITQLDLTHFISRIPVWNFACTRFHVAPRISANHSKPILNQHPRIHQQNLRPQDFISRIPVWNSHRTFRQTYPEPTSQDIPSKPHIVQCETFNVECIVSCATILICVSSMSHHECLWHLNGMASPNFYGSAVSISLGWNLVGLTYH